MRGILIVVSLTLMGCAGSSGAGAGLLVRKGAPAAPAPPIRAVHVLTVTDRGCVHTGLGVYVDPYTLVTASHIAVNLDSAGRTACESGGGFAVVGSHAIFPESIQVDGISGASVVDFSYDDLAPARVSTTVTADVVIQTATPVDGSAEIRVSSSERHSVVIYTARSSWSGRPYFRGVTPESWWGGAPVMQNEKVVGVYTTPEVDGGDFAEIK